MTSADHHFSQGNQLFVDEDYESALESYSAALDLDDANVEYYVKRAATLQKLGKCTDALADTRTALELEPSSHKALSRQGRILFELKDYEGAKASFFRAKSGGGNEATETIWLAKCNAELGLPADAPPAEPAAAGPGNTQISALSAPAAPASTISELRIKHDWYQSDAYVNISVMIKGLSQDDVECVFEERSASITAKLHTGADYNLELDLWNVIVPDQCVFVVRKTKIDIKLKKASPVRWTALEGDGTSDPAMMMQSADAVAAKAGVKTGRDWDALVVDIKKEEKEEKPEGEAALNALFKQIYGDGSDETKRAMMKSYVESGGTVLSTNWDEVGKGKVEMKPPEGMEYKKYEQ